MLKIYIAVLTALVAALSFVQTPPNPAEPLALTVIASCVYAVGLGLLALVAAALRWPFARRQKDAFAKSFIGAWSIIVTLAMAFHVATLATGVVPFKTAAQSVHASADPVDPEPDGTRGPVHQEQN